MRTVEPSALGRQIVPILGMHRAGTSMLTRMLHALGLELGGPLQGPAPDNPRGFWEHRFVQQLNMRLLSGCNCDRDGLDTPQVLRATAAQVARYAEPLAPALGRFFADKAPPGAFGFKDPRTVVTLPFWPAALTGLGLDDVRPIAVVRHPSACVRSLMRRGNRIPNGRGDVGGQWLSIWSAYYALIVEHAPDNTLWLSQSDLVDPNRAEHTLAQCARFLGLRAMHIAPALATVEATLLHHQLGREEPTGHDPIDRQYAALLARVQACQVSHPPAAQPTAFEPVPAPATPGQADRLPDCIYIVSPDGYRHSHALDELALSLHHGLSELGARAQIVNQPWQLRKRPLVLGPQLLSDADDPPLPDDSILYNLEQVSPGSPWFTDSYRALLRRFTVWDYSARNLVALRAWGVPDPRLCRPGFHPALCAIEPLPEHERDIDVLFYGSLNPRRAAVLAGLSEAGLQVVHLFGLYGAARDAYIQRAKLVLNVHHYDAQVLELVRLSYLLSNGVCVVSEPDGGDDPDTELNAGLWLAPYDRLVATCQAAVANPGRRAEIAATGKRLFAQRPQTAELRRALGP